MAKEKTSVQFYYEYIEQLEDLEDNQFRKVIEAMVEYDKTNKVNSLEPISKMAFKFIKKRIDYDKDRYLLICERNKNNGSKGGRPKNEDNPKEPKKPSGLFGNPNKPKKPDIDIDIDLDIDIDNKEEINKEESSSCSRFIGMAENEFINLSPIQYEMLNNLEKQYGDELCIEALKECSKNNKKTISYLNGILKNWNGNSNKNKSVPEWLDKKIEKQELNKEELKEMEDLFKEFRN